VKDRECRRIGDELRRLQYDRWQVPAGFAEAVLAKRRARANQQQQMEATHMRGRKLGLAAAAVFVCVVGIAGVASPSTFASIVDAGKRWFHFGPDSASQVSIADPADGQEARTVRVTAVCSSGESGVQVVSTSELTGGAEQMAADLEELEAGVADGRYTVEKSRGSLPSSAEGEPETACDVYTFRSRDGAGSAEVMADPETGSVICVSRSCGQIADAPAEGASDTGSVPVTVNVQVERADDGALRLRVTPVEPVPAAL
jgi:hypothetical protein